ncbi:MAG: thiamine phosphate synthase [Acidimicrobiales bacterium]
MPAQGEESMAATTLGQLHVITDTRPGRDPVAIVGAVLEAGAPVIQVRAKGLTDRKLYELSARVADLCVAHGADCIIDDRVDIAVAVGAAGAHVGADDLPVALARTVLGPDRWLGATARDPDTAWAHQRAGASYLGVGPTYATATKTGLPAPLGPSVVGRVAAAVSIPVIAIGNVTALAVRDLIDAGAHGVAVVSAVSEADDPRLATEELLRALDKAINA